MSTSKKVTVLAGAGLCKQVGLPTSIELAEKLKTTLEAAATTSTASEVAEQDRERSASHLATYRFLNGGIRFQQGILDGDPDQPVNIEQIAVTAEQLQTRFANPLSPYTSGWHHRIVDLEHNNPDLLLSFVSFIYSQLDHWLRLTRDNAEKVHYIRNLVEVCADGCSVDIFTLNYDLCIETALTRFAKRNFVNGFTEEGGWQPSRFDDRNSTIRLFKLHGSLDWVEDEVYGVCSLQFPRHRWAENIEGAKTRPLLIFGATHKLSPREPFLTLAYTFSQNVLQTKLLAVLGYSFGDEHINQIIKQGIEKNPKLRVLIVSPSAERKLREIPFLEGRQPRVIGLSEDAKTALNNGLFLNAVRNLLDKTSSEEPFTE